MVEVAIRAVNVDDCREMVALFQCPKVRRNTSAMPYRSPIDTRKQLESLPKTTHQLVAIESSTNQLVGVVTLTQLTDSRQHVGYVGIAVHDNYHGQRIGSRLLEEAVDIADNWLNLKRLELTVFVDNAPAVHLYEKFGFVIEGTLKKYAFRAGSYVDAYTMARIV